VSPEDLHLLAPGAVLYWTSIVSAWTSGPSRMGHARVRVPAFGSPTIELFGAAHAL
jgi:hypothetical protein